MGAHTIAGGLKWEQGAEPPEPPHFNHCLGVTWARFFSGSHGLENHSRLTDDRKRLRLTEELCGKWADLVSEMQWSLSSLLQAVRVATQYTPAPLLISGCPSASRATEQTQRSSTFPRRIRSHADRSALRVKAAPSKAA